ncbi:MAG: efflux RND transporter periplasmic adaptor subunit [Arcobacteraceae bacterium]|jgi:membrane fusion protein (multidrug efflux system)
MKKIIMFLLGLALVANGEEIYATFYVEASKSSNLAFDTSGIVKNTFADASSVVKKGQKLAELNSEELGASLAIAKASVESAEVNLKFALKDYDRQVQVKHLIDEAQFDRYVLALESAKVKLSEAKANLAYKKTLYNKTVLYAPYDGVIVDRLIDKGDAVSGAQLKTAFRIQSSSERKLILEFDQKYWQTVKSGQVFKFTIDGDLRTRTAKITKVYPYANNTNRKMKAEVRAGGFSVGLFGNGYITTSSK